MFKKYLLIVFIIFFSNTYMQARAENDNQSIINYMDIYYKLMSKEYIIGVKSFHDMNNIYKSLNEKQMRALSLKYKNDIERYAANKLKEIHNYAMEEFYYSGIRSIYTTETIDKYFMPEIETDYIKISAKDYHNEWLKEDYPELASVIGKYVSLAPAAPKDDKQYEEKLFGLMQLHAHSEDESESEESEEHGFDVILCLKYKGSNTVKIKGIFTLSNIKNDAKFTEEWSSDGRYINRYLPKTNFTSYDKSFELKNLSIRPKKFTYGNNIYPNILSEGKLGEVNFDAEITLSADSSIFLYRNGFNNTAFISVDEVKINKVLNSVEYLSKYDAHSTRSLDLEITKDVYTVNSDDGYAYIRNAPNGEIIGKFPAKETITNTYYLYPFEKYEESEIFSQTNDEKFNNKFRGYYPKIKQLLNVKETKVGQWIMVFHDNTTGYIDSSQLKLVNEKPDYSNVIFYSNLYEKK